MGLATLERGFKQGLATLELNKKAELAISQEGDTRKINENIPERFEDFAKSVFIRSGLEMIPFVPYDYQLILDKLIDTHRGVAAVKARQMGLTEYIACKFLHKAARFPGYLALVFSKNQKDTRNIARRIRLMANTCSSIKLSGSSLEDLSIENGGRIVFLTSTPNAGRGFESVSDILYDECAFVPAIEEIYGAASPAQRMLGESARTILLSTPDAKSGFYWNQLNSNNGAFNLLDVCRLMREGLIDPVQHWTATNGWAKFIVHFKAHPVYREIPDFLQHVKEQDNLTESRLQREYNLGFDDDSNQIFSQALVAAASTGTWHPPTFAHSYILSVDPSFGGGDYFTVQVWDITTPDRVSLAAEWRDHHKSKDYYLNAVYELLDEYAEAIVLLAIEVNSGGALYAQEIARDRPSLQVETVNHTNTSKLVHTDRLVLLHERGEITYPAESAIAMELPHFVEEVQGQGKTRVRHAESGHTDDAVMAGAVMAAWLDEARSLIHVDYSAAGTAAGLRESRAIAERL